MANVASVAKGELRAQCVLRLDGLAYSAGERCLVGERRALYRVGSSSARSRVQARERREPLRTEPRWQRMAALSAELSVLLEAHMKARHVWLTLDELQHAHWLEATVEHYHLGYEAGRAQASLDALATESTGVAKGPAAG
jgi:hypothetical protein